MVQAPTQPPTDIEVPWLAAAIEPLRQERLAGRFPPALLIHERRGAGGLWLARVAAQMALCRSPQPPCGHCGDCRRFCGPQGHPDFFLVVPAEQEPERGPEEGAVPAARAGRGRKSRIILIEQIRVLCGMLELTSHGGAARVALLHPADALNTNADNALLKTLEEPRPGVSLLLVTGRPGRLPATVRSRCQWLRIASPPRDQSIRWLERQRGSGPWGAVLDAIGEAPFEELGLDAAATARMAEETFRTLREVALSGRDPPGLAERWAGEEGFELRLTCIETWLTGCVDRGAIAPGELPEMRTAAHLPESGWDMNMATRLRLLDAAAELRQMRLGPLNRSVALERLLWQLGQGSGPAAGRG